MAINVAKVAIPTKIRRRFRQQHIQRANKNAPSTPNTKNAHKTDGSPIGITYPKTMQAMEKPTIISRNIINQILSRRGIRGPDDFLSVLFIIVSSSQ
jgi:hypothetical protein